ncbi:MAG: hypothetical protein M4579_001608 [Chaenotheca gracillima]|nr:MAG: hypothetical protein M4579_001608 [Chaenotheca gracillima]
MANSPMVSTPTSAGSPPPLAMKMPNENGKINITNHPTMSITSKEWIVPPRPKPGRKPATDTPPTKRKAQNRAAQRAFRERRAARVGELEDCMKEIEDKHVADQDELVANITRLEADVERFRDEVATWQGRCGDLEQTLQNERDSRSRAELDLSLLQQKISINEGTAVPLRRGQRFSEILSGQQQFGNEGSSDLVGCGNCTRDSRCECVEQALNTSPIHQDPTSSSSAKRPHSPEIISHMKRRQSTRNRRSIKADPAELETDFTNVYSRNDTIQMTEHDPTPISTVSPLPVSEQCGFCQDGTPCVCAELENQASLTEQNRLAPILSQFTPPPSEGDVQSSSGSTLPKPQPIHPSMHRSVVSNPCANGPGTCAQCMSDPNSTIFCKSLAAAGSGLQVAGAEAANGGCCGSAGPGGCCRAPPQRQSTVPTLSCADAYTALSRHPHYSEATDELETWLGHLRTKVPAGEEKNRPPMEVEAASVMGVLKMFDRRFGRE